MGSSDSLSLPSEPPDLGKWYSSYAYESPALNSTDDFKDPGCSILAEIGESEKKIKGDFDETGVQGKREALLADGKATSNGFLSCKSLTIRDNWANEVSETSNSLSLLSEPPDVKNWFCSYEYESPALDTCYEFHSHPIEHGMDKEENRALSSSTRKEEESDNTTTKAVEQHDLEVQSIPSGGLIKCTNLFGEKEYEHHNVPKDSQKLGRNKNSAVLKYLTPQWHSQQILDKKQMQDSGSGSAKDLEISIIDGGSSPDNFNAKFDTEASHPLVDVTSISESKKRYLPRKSFQRSDPTEELFEHEAFVEVISSKSSAKNSDFNLVDRRPVNKAPGGDDYKENHRNEFAESGFISTRKSKQTDEENSFRKPIKNGTTILPRGMKEDTATRKVLLETTNFQASNVLEITGKWRCPQKSKPNIGPPLKQLRLEQWVRRL